MQELDRALNLDVKPSSSRALGSSNGARENLTRSISEDVSSEGEKERALAKAALSVSELGEVTTLDFEYLIDWGTVALLDGQSDNNGPQQTDLGTLDSTVEDEIPLRSVNFVINHIPAIEIAQTTITNEMQKMVLSGLEDLVRTSPISAT